MAIVVQGERPHGKSENEDGSAPIIDILSAKVISGDTAYLIRLREDWDTSITYHVRRFTDFVLLDEKLKMNENPMLKTLPTLPTAGSRFGLRRSLSKLGLGNFVDRQHEGLQQYMETICSQIPNLAADGNLQAFLDESRASPADQDLLKAMLFEAKSGVTLAIIKGHWKVKDSDHSWTVDETGKALLDMEDRGDEYYITEEGQGYDRKIFRRDGWRVDIDKSTKDLLYWTMPGQEDLQWIRKSGIPPTSE